MSFAAPVGPARQRHVLLPFAVCTLVWGSTWLVIVTQLRFGAAAWSVFYRFAIGAAAMAILCRRSGIDLRLGRRGHGQALLIGIPQFGLNYLFVYAAEAHVASGLVALLSALLIVPNALFGWLLLGQKVSRRFVAGSALAIAGIAILFADDLHRTPAGARDIVRGVLFAVGGFLAASIANVTQAGRRARAYPSPALLGWAMAYGALFDGVFAWATAGAPRLPLDPVYLAGLLYLAIVGSALAFNLYFTMLRQVGPARASYVAVMIPIVAMTLSTLFEAYRWTPGAIAGCALALGGLLVAIRARSPA